MKRPPETLAAYRARVEPQRLDCVTVPLTIEFSGGVHHLAVCLAYEAGHRLREINLVSRGKIGQGLDLLLHDLGIKLSRAIQGRNAETGEEIAPAPPRPPLKPGPTLSVAKEGRA